MWARQVQGRSLGRTIDRPELTSQPGSPTFLIKIGDPHAASVTKKNTVQSLLKATYGVTQGFILGPLLFIL